ncbi:MAG: argininosuccinate lyase [Blastocatellia bacterium]
MENTGRILRVLTPGARRILFNDTADDSITAELDEASQVDRAHLVMLAETGIAKRHSACALLKEIDRLRASNFEPLRGLPAPRGLFLLYESYLIEKLGGETGGILQTARSRNDLNATTLRMRMRKPYQKLLREALRLQAVLINRGRRFADVVMPIYTHYQPALPVTFGHYLLGVAYAVERDIAGIVEAARGLSRCPLGAGAVGGTSLPIDPSVTAGLLGFDGPIPHSIDAVASRDLVTRLLAATTLLGVTLSRLATDFLLWSTAEFGFLKFPDHLVGSSSMMPQKRNPFILEHVQGRSAAPLGGFVAAVTAMHATPYTNSIAVGTEAVSHVWKSLQDITETVTLTRLAIDGARPDRAPMLERAVHGYTTATELANRLVVEGGQDFRAAHHAVGTMIREGIDRKELLQEVMRRQIEEGSQSVSTDGLDPISVARKSNGGGGPGQESTARCIEELEQAWRRDAKLKNEQARKWKAADLALDKAVRKLCEGSEAQNRDGNIRAEPPEYSSKPTERRRR